MILFLCKKIATNFLHFEQLNFLLDSKLDALVTMLKVFCRANTSGKLIIDRINEPFRFQALVIPHY